MKLIINISDETVIKDIVNRTLEPQTETDKVIIDALYNGKCCSTGNKLIGGDTTHYYYCSACEGSVDIQDNFCRYCGADFRGE